MLLVAAILASACATGAGVQRSLPAPPRPAERLGQWDLPIALYDPALFGPERPLAELIKEFRLPLDNGRLKNARLLVNKSQRRLELWVLRRMVKAYRVQLGWNPNGPKIRQGDKKTPEGEYFICARLPSTYHMSLWISYPNLADARRGLESGLITDKEYEAIVAALGKGACPPQNTNLGGNLLLHGQDPDYTAELARAQRTRPGPLRPGGRIGDADPAAVPEFEDWTDGCVALFNPDIRELYEFVPDGAPITIVADGQITLPPKSRR
ncbi:MAG: L,D-transpeptidase family protein [Candidatus Aminicenantales bacterium]